MTLISTGMRCAATLDTALQEALPRWIGCQRFTYNSKVSEDRYFNQFARNALSLTGERVPADQQYAQFKDKELTPWLYDVPSQVLRNGAVRWMVAKRRQLVGLAQAPRIRKQHDFNSVLLTSELFRFVEVVDKVTKKIRHEIEIGTTTHPIGRVQFRSKRAYDIPKTIVLRRVGSGKWWVSFTNEQESEVILRTVQELAYELNALSDTDLDAVTIAMDRNVKANKVADSEGEQYDFKPSEKTRLARKAVGCKKYQRKLARQIKGSKNQKKTKRKIANKQEYGGNVRNNFAHQTSHALVALPMLFYVFEALKTSNMTKKPKAKQSESGKWLPNGARAKAGLNSAILGSAWGKTLQYTEYKAARQNKLVVRVSPHFTSQECSVCGYTHPDNRNSEEFVCKHCGFVCHADINAAKVQKKRGIVALRAGAYAAPSKPKKCTAFQRAKTKVVPKSEASTALDAGGDTPAVTVCGEMPAYLSASHGESRACVRPQQPNWL